MKKYEPSDRVFVYPFSCQKEGEDIVIGIVERNVFIALPADALEILENLRSGETIGRSRELYISKFNEVPDMDDLLGILEAKGFISSSRGATESEITEAAGNTSISASIAHHFEWIGQPLAACLFGRRSLKVYSLIVATGMVFAALDPSLIPGRDSLYFAEYRAPRAVLLFLLSYLTIFVHELAHLIAARAVGIGARMGISHRLWFLVAETDLTGLWSVPKRDRYIPFIAGPIIDTVSASLLYIFVYLCIRGPIRAPVPLLQFLQAMIFLYLMRLVWQCFFFTRTDFYYVIANLFGCRNLLGDTEAFLRNQLSRLRILKFKGRREVPPSEMRVVRVYAPLWLLGRALAFGILFYVTLPVSFKYLHAIISGLQEGLSSHSYEFVDSLVLGILSLVPFFIGLGFWLNSIFKDWRKNRGISEYPVG
jgi:putative peptide zinc metalloprotease protein